MNDDIDSSSTPSVSVIMGVHNEAAHLREAIDSVLDQSFSDFEFIIVDDASDDATPELLNELDDGRVHICRNDENLGLTRSLNNALERARGEFVARQDADDISHPERLERQVSFLERHGEVDLVGTGAYLIDSEGNILHRRRVLSNVTYDKLLTRNHLIHGSVLVRRSVLEELGGYDERFRFSQDLDLWLRLSQEHQIRNLPSPLYFFRIHEKSVYFDSMRDSMLYALLALESAQDGVEDAVFNDIREHGIESYYDHLSRGQRLQFHIALAERLLRYGHVRRAREESQYALEVNKLDPKAVVMYMLSFMGKGPTRLARTAIRRYINARIAVANRVPSRHNWNASELADCPD